MEGTFTLEPDGAEVEKTSAPVVFLALDAGRPHAGGARYTLHATSEVTFGRGDARGHRRTKQQLRIDLADHWVSECHATLSRTPSGWLLADRGSKNGMRVNGATTERVYLHDGDVFELGQTFFILRSAVPARDDLDSAALTVPRGFATLVPELADRFTELAKLASMTRASIIIRGPTGSGKELCATAVHALSRRRGELIAVNCGAIPASLVESELFGHVRGAFSGADRERRGLVEAADGGSLFLDEIGELPPAAQAALLRVLQDGHVRPVGATQSTIVDLRVLAATHRALPERVERGEFRADLYARLAGFELELPALEDRREDLGLLVAALLPTVTERDPATVVLSREVARAFLAYDWPLNIRELATCLTRAITLAGDRPVAIAHLPEVIGRAKLATAPVSTTLSTEEVERRDRLVALLEHHHGNVSRVAEELGTLRQTIQKWIRRYQIDVHAFRK